MYLRLNGFKFKVIRIPPERLCRINMFEIYSPSVSVDGSTRSIMLRCKNFSISTSVKADSFALKLIGYGICCCTGMLVVSTVYPQTVLKIQRSDVISVQLDLCNRVLPTTKFSGVFLSDKDVELISELCKLLTVIVCLFCWSPIGVSGISSPVCEMVCGCEQSPGENFGHGRIVCFV